MKTTLRGLAFALLLSPLPATADDATAAAHAETAGHGFGFGARIGGYGFREPKPGEIDWTDCRMDGLGVFATMETDDHFFGEAELDYYQAHGSAVAEGMDRESAHLLVSVGARMFPHHFLTPYVQVGGGAEWTQLTITATGGEREELLPAGFIGFGAEVNVTDHLKVGSNLRMFVMAHPAHETSTASPGTSHHALTAADEAVPLDYGAAGQLQFFVRYAL